MNNAKKIAAQVFCRKGTKAQMSVISYRLSVISFPLLITSY